MKACYGVHASLHENQTAVNKNSNMD